MARALMGEVDLCGGRTGNDFRHLRPGHITRAALLQRRVQGVLQLGIRNDIAERR